jgi:hypothetical protein
MTRGLLVLSLLALLAVPVAVAPARAEMSFRWVPLGDARVCGDDCPRAIEATGTIGPRTAENFAAFVTASAGQPRRLRVVLLHSPGGVLFEAFRLGAMFRALEMITVVGRFVDPEALAAAGVLTAEDAARVRRVAGRGERPVTGTCLSACVYALIGGARRIVPPASRVGVHRPHRAPQPTEPSLQEPGLMVAWDRTEVARLQRVYVETMGVAPRLIAFEHAVPSRSMRILTQAELRSFRIVTGGPAPLRQGAPLGGGGGRR